MLSVVAVVQSLTTLLRNRQREAETTELPMFFLLKLPPHDANFF